MICQQLSVIHVQLYGTSGSVLVVGMLIKYNVYQKIRGVLKAYIKTCCIFSRLICKVLIETRLNQDTSNHIT